MMNVALVPRRGAVVVAGLIGVMVVARAVVARMRNAAPLKAIRLVSGLVAIVRQVIRSGARRAVLANLTGLEGLTAAAEVAVATVVAAVADVVGVILGDVVAVRNRRKVVSTRNTLMMRRLMMMRRSGVTAMAIDTPCTQGVSALGIILLTARTVGCRGGWPSLLGRELRSPLLRPQVLVGLGALHDAIFCHQRGADGRGNTRLENTVLRMAETRCRGW